MCQKAQQAGASWISVHGRTAQQRCQPVNYEAIAQVKASVSVPVVANGDIKSLTDALTVKERTNVDGVMAARGILANPAMFAGFEQTPLECVQKWVGTS